MVGAGMVEIPAGRFRMGSVGFYPEVGPVREVEVVSRSTALASSPLNCESGMRSSGTLKSSE